MKVLNELADRVGTVERASAVTSELVLDMRATVERIQGDQNKTPVPGRREVDFRDIKSLREDLVKLEIKLREGREETSELKGVISRVEGIVNRVEKERSRGRT